MLTFTKEVNPELLQQELDANFGARWFFVTYSKNEHQLRITAASGIVLKDHEATISSIVERHDPTQKTAIQEIVDNAEAAKIDLAAIIGNRIAWHEANPPVDAASALEVVQRMQMEWIKFLKYFRNEVG